MDGEWKERGVRGGGAKHYISPLLQLLNDVPHLGPVNIILNSFHSLLNYY